MIPRCANRCELVATLIAEIARLKGTSEQVERLAHGLDGEDGAPPPDLSFDFARGVPAPHHHEPPTYRCDRCGAVCTSIWEAAECCDPPLFDPTTRTP